jgi:hypothetical protein
MATRRGLFSGLGVLLATFLQGKAEANSWLFGWPTRMCRPRYLTREQIDYNILKDQAIRTYKENDKQDAFFNYAVDATIETVYGGTVVSTNNFYLFGSISAKATWASGRQELYREIVWRVSHRGLCRLKSFQEISFRMLPVPEGIGLTQRGCLSQNPKLNCESL